MHFHPPFTAKRQLLSPPPRRDESFASGFRQLHRLVLFVALMLPLHTVHAQFAIGFGGTGPDEGFSIAVDAAGNSFVTGGFQNTVDFDPGPGTFEVTSNGPYSIFIASYDNAGTLRFAFGLGGLSPIQNGYGIALDAAGNCYVVGSFLGTVDFDPGPGTFELESTLASGLAVGSDVFVASYDNTGAFRFAFSIGDIGFDWGLDITVDAAGNFYITGGFDEGTADFDPGPDVFEVTNDNGGIFVASYDETGAFRFAFGIDNVFATFADAFGITPQIAVDTAGNTFITGTTLGTPDLDPGPDTAAVATNEIFVSSYDSAGGFRFAYVFEGVASPRFSSGIAIDAAGNSYVTGTFGGTLDFDPGDGVFELTEPPFSPDIFVASYDNTGALRFAFKLDGAIPAVGTNITVDSEGNSYVTGRIGDTVDFDPSPGLFELSSNGDDDIFVASYDNAGAFRFALSIGGIDRDGSSDIALDNDGNSYITGNFKGTVDFDPGPDTFELTSFTSGGSDIFVASYSASGTFPVNVEQADALPDVFHLSAPYPNPFTAQTQLSLQVEQTQQVKVAIFDVLGRRVREVYQGQMVAGQARTLVFDGAGLPGGVYWIRVEGERFASARRMVLR